MLRHHTDLATTLVLGLLIIVALTLKFAAFADSSAKADFTGAQDGSEAVETR